MSVAVAAIVASIIVANDPELGLVRRSDEARTAVVDVSDSDLAAVADAVGTAIEQAAANRPRKIVVFTQVGCGPCKRMYNEDIPGDDLDLEFRQEQPVWLESFPAIWLPDVNRVVYGYRSHDRLRAILSENPVGTKAVQAMTLGSLAIRKQVAAILDNVTNRGGQTEIAIGSGVVILPAQMQMTGSITPDGGKIVFTGTKPRYRWGSGFLALGADINSLTLSRTELVVGVNGLSDVRLEVTP